MKYDPNVSVREARIQYFRSNGLPDDGAINSRWIRAKYGPVRFLFINFDARRSALKLHDVHHIVTGTDVSMYGEAMEAGWEIGSGCGKYWVAWFLELQALSWGFVLCPRDTFRRYLLGRRSKSLYHRGWSEDLLNLSVGALRDVLLPSSKHILPAAFDYISFFGYGLLGVILFVCTVLCFLIPPVLLAPWLLSFVIQ
jgi:hypothetical protein